MRIPQIYSKKKARVEIIPLIDVVFFLLATFVMVSLSMVKNEGISVQLPKAASSEMRQDRTFTVLTVTENNEVYFNKDKISTKDLAGRLRRLKESEQDPKILINGDSRALFDSAIFVLDEVRKSGITKVSVQTASKEGNK